MKVEIEASDGSRRLGLFDKYRRMQEGEGAGFCEFCSTKEKIDHLVASRSRWLEYKGKRVTQQEKWLSDLQDVNHEGTMAKAPPCSERRLRTSLL